MSGVGITGKIVPLNGGAFPVWEDINGQGGLRTVATIAARNAVSANALFCKEGMLVYVTNTGCIYELAADLVTWNFYDANPALAAQLSWYVDPSGNDANDGKTAGTALLTLVELQNRLNPRGKRMILTNAPTIFINTVSNSVLTYPEITLLVGTSELALAFFILTIVCGITSSAPITLTAVTYPKATTLTRGAFVTGAGNFVAQERIRMTSGTANGAVCYSTGLNGDAQHTFVSALSIPTWAGITANGGHGSTLQPLPGDTCVVDTLVTSINKVTIDCIDFARVIWSDAKITSLTVNGSSSGTPFAGSGGPVLMAGCQMVSTNGRWLNNCWGAILVSCRQVAAKLTALIGNNWSVIDSVVQGQLNIDGQTVSAGLTLDGGTLFVGESSDPNHPGQSSISRLQVFNSYTNLATGNQAGAIECENGVGGANPFILHGGAVVVCEGASLELAGTDAYLWGASANYGFGVTVMHNAYVTIGNLVAGTIAALFAIPSTVNLLVGNLQFAYSDNQISIPNCNCGIIASSYGAGFNINATDAAVRLTLQTANIASTPLLGMTASGLFQVSAWVATTTADAAAVGTPTVNIIYTDDSGVAHTTAVATAPSLVAANGAGGVAIIENASPNNLAWSVTGITAIGAAKYSLRLRVEQISLGP